MKTNTTTQFVALVLATVVTAVSFAGIGVYAETRDQVVPVSAPTAQVETITVTASRLA
jgi:hypothetical protein